MGASSYVDIHPEWADPHARVYVKFRPGGASAGAMLLALLDTGGHYCILDEVAAASVKDQLTDHLGSATLRTAHGPVSGELYVLRIELVAEVGQDLAFEAVTFIASEWRAPSYLGCTGALDRVRFAVDPENNRFFFGCSA